MKDKEILAAVDYFIDHRLYHYALMINGTWGCGKTFFTNQVLIPYLREERKLDVNYISLYGIKEADEIANKLCERAIRDKITKNTGKNTEGKGAQIAGLVISKLLKYGIRRIDVESSDLEGIAEKLPNYDNNVIIFDDLERCQCDVCTVLGYINDFIEHSDASVILIANENEIGKSNLEENQELQMLVALNKRLNIHLPATTIAEAIDDRRNKTKDVPKQYFTPDEVHRARKLIFLSGEQYRRTKEKVVGLTIDYEPDLESVFSKLIESNIPEEALRKRLLNEVSTYVQLVEREKHCNIRSFLFFLEKMKQIYSVISEDAYPALQQVALYCLRSTISRMKGEKPPVWDEKEYGMQTFGMGFAPEDHPYGFKFIDDLITSNTIDYKKVDGVLSSYCRIETARGSLENDPYQRLPTWYELNDEELEAVLNEIDERIKAGKYSTCIFPDIIHYLVYFIEDDLAPGLCNQIIESMKCFIENAPKERLEPFLRERFILEGKSLELYNQKIKEITVCLNNTTTQTEADFWRGLADGENWGKQLLSGVGPPLATKRSFVYWLEPEKIYELIKHSSNSEIYVFRTALHKTYNSGYYYEHQKEDLPHLKKLLELLLDNEGMGKIQAKHCSWIRNDLEKWIKEFSTGEQNEEEK